MDIKRVCRLCCSKDEVQHSLFGPSEGGVSLAEELRILTDIEIKEEEHLSERICVNCYKVNSFFKEFRKNCSAVNNYFKKLQTSEKTLPCDITIKEEKLDDYEDQSADPLVNQLEGFSKNCDTPYPVALVHSSESHNNLAELRSNFLSTKRSREEASAPVIPEGQNVPSSIPVKRAEKRKNGDVDGAVRRLRQRVDIPSEEDLLNHVVKQEEVDLSDSPVEGDNLNEGSLDEPWSPHESHFSLVSGNDGGQSSPNDDSCSSLSSCSSDDSDDEEDDSDMLMLLALLL